MRFASRTLLALVVSAPLVMAALLDCGHTSSSAAPADAGDVITTSGEAGSPASVRSALERDPAVAADIPVAVEANNAFALDLYDATGAKTSGNYLLSPISAHLALTMMYAGANGETASQMKRVLHIPSGSPSIFDAENALSQALASRGPDALSQAKEENATDTAESDYRLDVVNSLWGQRGLSWDAPFLSTLAKSYGAGMNVEDFVGDPTGAESTINAWVSKATDGKIDPLLPDGAINSATQVVLVNAVHEKLPWAYPFDPTATVPGPFTRGDGTVLMPPLMHQTYGQVFGYQATPDGQFVSLPLYGGQVSVVFALPTNDLASLTRSLTSDVWTLAPTDYEQLILTVPSFEFTTATFPLSNALIGLGMTDAFADSADFSGICASPPHPIFISTVLQKATITVDDSGAEAAAATAIVGDDTAAGVDVDAGDPTSITVTLDRPFLFAVVDATGAVLFLGQIDDPTNTGS